MNWEYMHVTDGTLAVDRWVTDLNVYGSLGWEVVSITATDPTLGLNSYTAVLKRPALTLPSPRSEEAGWYDDPSGRHGSRFWDGLRWSQHVSTAGVTDIDAPNVRPAG